MAPSINSHGSASAHSRSPLPLIGREFEIGQVLALLDAGQTRLLTLTGPGGVGKTRLAQEALARLEGEYADGAVFVPLALIQNSDLVPAAVSRACGIPERGGSSEDSLIRALRNQHLLLVLDNYEHLLDAQPAWLVDLLSTCPRLKFLVTSRVALNLHDEQRFRVAPLAVPEDESSGVRCTTPSEELFMQRARAIRPDFTVDDRKGEAVAELCRRLDGLPLAIELAAARINILSPAEMLTRLTDRLGLLTGGPRDAPLRLRSMRDAIAWSYDLLTPDEQRPCRQVSVFVGGFTLDAAEAVCEMPAESPLDTLSCIASLVDKSLLQSVHIEGSPTRYLMLETIREFGAQQLTLSGEEEDVRNRHAEWCLVLAKGTRADPDPVHHALAIDRFGPDYANFQAALSWLESSGQAQALLELVIALEFFWNFGGHEVEGLTWFRRVLDSPQLDAQGVRLDALLAVGVLGHVVNDPDTDSFVAGAYSLAQESGTLSQRGDAAYNLGMRAEDLGNYASADEFFRVSREYYTQSGSKWHIVMCDYHFGVVAYGQGTLEQAVARLEAARLAALGLDDPFVPLWCLVYLAFIACERGDTLAAAEYLRQHPNLDRLGYRHHQPLVRAAAGVLATELGEHETAARLFGSTAHDVLLFYPEKVIVERSGEKSHQVLGDKPFAHAWEAGRRMSQHEVEAEIRRLLNGSGVEVQRPDHDRAGETLLSPRELEVLRLLADGQSNQQIADALFISLRTAAHHVANILAKLDLTSRTSAVAYAIRHGLA